MSETTEPSPAACAATARAAAKTLARVDDGLRWAFSAGWYPTRRWIGEPKGAEMRLARPDDDDRVAGARDDIGMGDYAARRVVRAAGPRLSTASATVGEVVAAVAAARRSGHFPRPVSVASLDSLDALTRATRQLSYQLDLVYDAGAFALFNSVALAWAHGKLTSTADLLTALERSLARWTEGVPESRSVPIALCVTCDLRPRPIRKGVVAGRECDTCATWRYRHKGQARPKALDKDDRAAATAARQRRAAAGLGWGMA
jgi:hypothetical protein